MGTPDGFKLAIGIQEYDFFVKPGERSAIDVIVSRENGSMLAKARLLESGAFIIYDSPLNSLEQLGIEKLLEVGKPDIENAAIGLATA